MNLIKNIFLFFFILFITSCADYKSSDVSKEIEKKYYSSKGFALIYEDSLYKEKIINKKMDNSKKERTTWKNKKNKKQRGNTNNVRT